MWLERLKDSIKQRITERKIRKEFSPSMSSSYKKDLIIEKVWDNPVVYTVTDPKDSSSLFTKSSIEHKISEEDNN